MEETASKQRTKDREWLQYDSEQAWDRGGCQRENSRQVQGRRPGILQPCRACLGRQEHLEESKVAYKSSSINMRALTVTPGVKNSIRLAQIDEPSPTASQALLRVREIGVCGTDMDLNQGFYGEAPPGSSYLVTGHESLSTVESIPRNNQGISKGDLVVPTVRRPDDCINCQHGESDMCLTGNYREHGIKRLHGFGSDFAVSDVDFLVKVPSKLANVAVLLEPMSVAEKGVYQAFKIQERMLWKPKRVLILGAGPVGLPTTYLLRLKGLEVVVTATRAIERAKAQLAQR